MSRVGFWIVNAVAALGLGLFVFAMVLVVHNYLDGTHCTAAGGVWVESTCIDRAAVIKP